MKNITNPTNKKRDNIKILLVKMENILSLSIIHARIHNIYYYYCYAIVKFIN